MNEKRTEEPEIHKNSHPWEEFLNARLKVIFWLKEERDYDDETIAYTLSVDSQQVYLIRTHPLNQPK